MFMMMVFMHTLSQHLAIHFGGTGAITHLAGDGTPVGDGDLAGDHLGDGDLHGVGDLLGTDRDGVALAGVDQVGIDRVGDHHGVVEDLIGEITPIIIIDVLPVAQILV